MSCIISQPSSASKAHFAPDCPEAVISTFSINILFIAAGAIPTHLALSISISLYKQCVGTLKP